MRWAVLFAAAFLAGAQPARATAGAEDFAAARAELSPHWDGQLDTSQVGPRLLRRLWSVAESAGATYLAAHPSASPEQLERSLTDLDPDASVQAVRLDDHSFIVSFSWQIVSDVFILSIERGRVGVPWAADRIASASRGDFEPLLAFSASYWRDDCLGRLPEKPADCGPVGADVGRLADTAASERRFYVNASFAANEGLDDGGQISFWRWDGRRAAPLSVHTYWFLQGAGPVVRISGGVVHVHVKDGFRSFFNCAPCGGRERDWRFRVTPTKIVNLGKRSDVPELDFIDDLFHRALTGAPMGDIASPQITGFLHHLAVSAGGTDANPTFGTLDDWMVSADGTQACIETDEGGTALFTLQHRDGHWMAASATALRDDTCKSQLNWPNAKAEYSQ